MITSIFYFRINDNRYYTLELEILDSDTYEIIVSKILEVDPLFDKIALMGDILQ